MTYGPPGGQPPEEPSPGFTPPPSFGASAVGQPGGPGQPSQYGYGAPAGQYGAAPTKRGFDAKSVNPLDWAVLGLTLLTFICSFISYYTASASASGGCPVGTQAQLDRTFSASDASGSAWHGFFGWFGVLLAFVGAILLALSIFAPHIKLPLPVRLLALGAFTLALLSTLLALVVDPVATPSVQLSSACKIQTGIGHGFGYWACLILIAAATLLTLMRVRQAGGKPPAQGGYQQPPAGYGQPPQQ